MYRNCPIEKPRIQMFYPILVRNFRQKFMTSFNFSESLHSFSSTSWSLPASVWILPSHYSTWTPFSISITSYLSLTHKSTISLIPSPGSQTLPRNLAGGSRDDVSDASRASAAHSSSSVYDNVGGSGRGHHHHHQGRPESRNSSGDHRLGYGSVREGSRVRTSQRDISRWGRKFKRKKSFFR